MTRLQELPVQQASPAHNHTNNDLCKPSSDLSRSTSDSSSIWIDLDDASDTENEDLEKAAVKTTPSSLGQIFNGIAAQKLCDTKDVRRAFLAKELGPAISKEELCLAFFSKKELGPRQGQMAGKKTEQMLHPRAHIIYERWPNNICICRKPECQARWARYPKCGVHQDRTEDWDLDANIWVW